MPEATSTPLPTGWQRWRTFVVAFPLLLALTLLWSLATPPMASPDEPAHAMRAASAALGQPDGIPGGEPGVMLVRVQQYFTDIERHINCFRRDTTATPACVAPVPDADSLSLGRSTAGSNPSPFYIAVGWPAAILDGQKALYGMRGMVAVLSALFLAFAFTALRQLRSSRYAVWGLALGVTPMVLFLSGVVNPNGIEAAAAVALLAWLVLTFREPSTRATRIERAAVVTASAAVLVSTRSISLVWLLIAVVAALLVSERDALRATVRSPATWIGVAAIGAATIAATLFYTRPQELALTYTPIGAGSTWEQGFFTTLDRTLEYGLGWIGHFGWLDTPAPTFTLLVYTLAVGAIVVIAFVVSAWRVRIAIGVVAVAALLVPAITQAAVVHDVGYVWQGRYTLALFLMLVVLAGFGIDSVESGRRTSVPVRRLVMTVAVLVAAAQWYAFVWTLRRYVIGLSWDTTWIDMVLRPVWQPPAGWIPLALAYAALLAAAIVVLWRSTRMPPDPGTASPRPAERVETIGAA